MYVASVTLYASSAQPLLSRKDAMSISPAQQIALAGMVARIKRQVVDFPSIRFAEP
jgi:hypothetical protein